MIGNTLTQSSCSCVNGRATSSFPTRTNQYASCTMSEETVLTPCPTVMANISVPCAETLTQCLATPGIDKTQCLYNIVTPYDPLAWGISLCESRLLYSFPCLIFDLTYGTL